MVNAVIRDPSEAESFVQLECRIESLHMNRDPATRALALGQNLPQQLRAYTPPPITRQKREFHNANLGIPTMQVQPTYRLSASQNDLKFGARIFRLVVTALGMELSLQKAVLLLLAPTNHRQFFEPRAYVNRHQKRLIGGA